MANIKSQIKRAHTNEKKRKHNVAFRSSLKSAIKNVLVAVEAKDAASAKDAFILASKKLDQSVTKGIHHKNYVARQKSRLALAINSIA